MLNRILMFISCVLFFIFLYICCFRTEKLYKSEEDQFFEVQIFTKDEAYKRPFTSNKLESGRYVRRVGELLYLLVIL